MKNLVFVFICLLLLNSKYFTSDLMGQDSIIRFTSPINNQENIPLVPQILITTDWEIDASSITYIYPNLDSNIISNIDKPTLTLIPDLFFDSLPDNAKKLLSRKCTYTLISPNMLQITPIVPLYPGIKYRAELSNLKLIDPLSPGWNRDTIIAPTITMTFTSTELPHYLLENKYLSNKMINCRDTLSFRFNRSINPNIVPLDSILIVEKLDSTSKLNDSTFVNHWTRLVMNLWFDSTDNTIYGKPLITPNPGDEFKLSIQTSYINGDITSNSEAVLRIKEYAKLTINNVLLPDSTVLNESLTFPYIGTSFFKVGDSLNIFSKIDNDSLAFSHYLVIDKNYDSAIVYNNDYTMLINCDDINDLNIVAYYRRKDSLNLMLHYVEGTYVSVFNSNNYRIGGFGDYTIGIGDFVTVSFDSTDNNKTAKGFIVDKISKINSDKLNIVIANNGRHSNIDVTPDYEEKEQDDPPYYRYDVEVLIDGNSCYITNPIFYGDQLAYGESPVPPALPEVRYPSVSLYPTYSDKYEIYKVEIWKSNSLTNVINLNPGISTWELSSGIRPTKPATTYRVYIRSKVKHKIIVETGMIKVINSIIEIGYDKDVYIEVVIRNCAKEYDNTKIQRFYTFSDSIPLIIDSIEPGSAISVYAHGQYHTSTGRLEDQGWPIDFLYWEIESPYYFSNVSGESTVSNNSSSFTFNIQDDVIIKGMFKENFRLERVGVYRNDSVEPTWYKAKELERIGLIDEIDTKRYDLNPIVDDGYMVKLLLDFNNEPDLSSILVNHSVRVEEISERVDALMRVQYLAGFNYNTKLADSDNSIVEFILKNMNSCEKLSNRNFNSIPKGEFFKLSISTGITDTSGNSYKVNQRGEIKTACYTELPGVLVKFKEINFLSESGFLDNAIELDNYSVVSVQNSTTHKTVYPPEIIVDSIYTIPQVHLTANIKSDTPFYPEQDLLNYWEMKRHYFVNYNFVSWDGDGAPNEIGDQMQAYVQSVLAILFAILTPREPSTPIQPGGYSYGWLHSILVAISFGTTEIIEFISNKFMELIDLITGFREADFLGNATFNYDWENTWFGASPHLKNQLYTV